jgi:hypothetical protein
VYRVIITILISLGVGAVIASQSGGRMMGLEMHISVTFAIVFMSDHFLLRSKSRRYPIPFPLPMLLGVSLSFTIVIFSCIVAIAKADSDALKITLIVALNFFPICLITQVISQELPSVKKRSSH